MAGSAGLSSILAPANGALLGLYYGAGTTAATDTLIGRKPQIHLVYYAWTDDWTQGAYTRWLRLALGGLLAGVGAGLVLLA